MADMKKKYNEEVVPALMQKMGYKNVMQVPKLKKIVLSMGIGTKMEKDAFTGVMVTLRGSRMYEFLDRFVHNALPRIRDFRGVPKKGFDKVGDYNMGIQDVSVFTEIDLEKLKYPMGLNRTIVTSAQTDAEAKELLALMEVPFAR